MLKSFRTLGLVFPLRAEAQAVVGKKGWRKNDIGRIQILATSFEKKIICIQPGPGPERTFAAVNYLSEEKADCIGCFGIAAGLDPKLLPGTLVLAEEVLDCRNSEIVLRTKTDFELFQGIGKALRSNRLKVVQGSFWGGYSTVASKEEKSKLFQNYGTLTADMESGELTSRCQEIGLPCFILRSVCDPADKNIPWQLSGLLNKKGDINLIALSLHLIRKPSLIQDIPDLAKHLRSALWTLGRAWSIVINCLD